MQSRENEGLPGADALNRCRSLFLISLLEKPDEGLRIEVHEGIASGNAKPVNIAGVTMDGLQEVAPSPLSAVFEIRFADFIGYFVSASDKILDAAMDDDVVTQDGKIQILSKSRFRAFIGANPVLPEDFGWAVHYRILCEWHIVDILSSTPPLVRTIRNFHHAS